MTNLEQQVLAAIKADCEQDFSSSVKEVAAATGLDVKTVKGVVGSLVKKDRVAAEQEERGGRVFLDLFYKSESGEVLSFGDYA